MYIFKKMYSLVSFQKCIHPWNHITNQYREYIHWHPKYSCTPSSSLPPQTMSDLLCVIIDYILELIYIKPHSAFFFGLDSFTHLCNYCEIHPCYYLYQQFIPFYCWAVFPGKLPSVGSKNVRHGLPTKQLTTIPCLNIPQDVYPFTYINKHMGYFQLGAIIYIKKAYMNIHVQA